MSEKNPPVDGDYGTAFAKLALADCLMSGKGVDKDEKNDKGVYIRRERYAGQCARTFYVGEDVKQEDIKAKFEDGILKVTIPKIEHKAVEAKKYIAIEG